MTVLDKDQEPGVLEVVGKKEVRVTLSYTGVDLIGHTVRMA